jgi:hypothetical protein
MNRGIEGRRIVDDDQDRSDLVRRLGELAAACKKNGASLTELRSGSRRGKLPTIRVALVSNLVEDFGVALADVARQLGISASGFRRY